MTAEQNFQDFRARLKHNVSVYRRWTTGLQENLAWVMHEADAHERRARTKVSLCYTGSIERGHPTRA